MNKKLLIIAGVLIVVAVVLYILSVFVFNKSNVAAPVTTTTQTQTNTPAVTTPTTTTFPLDDTTSSALIKQATNEFNFAFGKAKEWRPDSTPVAVVVKYTGSINRANGKNTYVFISPSLAQYYFTLTMDQALNAKGENNYERVLQFKSDYFLPQDTSPMPIKYWVINYIDALKKADDLGGKNIRASNKTYDVNLVLSSQAGKYLLWDVEYMVGGQKLYSVAFDSYQGVVQ